MINIKICFISMCSLCCALFIPSTGYSDSFYNLSIKNDLNIPLKYEFLSEKCTTTSTLRSSSDYIINPKSTKMASFIDKNSGGCWNQEKKITIRVYALVEEAYNNPDGVYYMDIRWRHKNNLPWQTKMYDITSGDLDKRQLQLSDARCDGSYCLNLWTNQSGDSDLSVTISASEYAKYMYTFKSILLGDVYVQDGLGGEVVPNPDTGAVELRYDTEKYYVKFKNSPERCTIIEGMINCPKSIDFLRKDRTIIFTCAQVRQGDSACPWATPHTNA
ncbi:hypothetical protein L3V82_05265 [Thiotrichales bacterium 19S3-7]|nr:hypothetical protein [Thiotrichales bacterium 19S3-7]MCF6801502.1 hypothetical protein [Thiotrichales bacterium 19S3-11]